LEFSGNAATRKVDFGCKMEKEYRRRKYLLDKMGWGKSDLSLCRIREIRGCSGGYGNYSHGNQGIAQVI